MLGRGVAAAGVLLSADVHLVLYFDGFKDIKVIGPAFLLNAIGGIVIGVAVLVWRHWLPLVAAIAFGISTLTAFYISATVGLFGVHETLTGNQVVLAEIAEWVAIAGAGTALVGRAQEGLKQREGAVSNGRPGRGSAEVAMAESGAELMRTLHDEHAAALWSFVLGLTSGDRGRAEDVVQETLLRAWRRPELMQPDGDGHQNTSIRSWLFTVARNIVVDQWRAGRRRPESLMDAVPEQLEPDRTDAALQSMLVGEALRRLTPEHRAVLLECYFRGSTAAQAAHRLGIPLGTVKSRTHYALHALRLGLQEMGVVT